MDNPIDLTDWSFGDAGDAASDTVTEAVAAVEAMIFMKGEQDMVAYYEKMYEEALAQLNRLGTGLERGDAYRDGQARIKVNP